MPEAPCNDFCRGDCKKGCAFNLLCICCDECIEPPAEQTALAADTPPTPGEALIAFLLHSPHAAKARTALGKAIKAARKAGDLPDPATKK